MAFTSRTTEDIIAAVKTHTKKYRYILIAIVLVLLILIPYKLGFRLGAGFHLERVGTLTISGLPKGTSVFVDQSLRGVTKKDGSMEDELVAGSHPVIVSVSGDYPWSTLAEVSSGKPSTIYPILVSMRPNATLLTGDDRTAALAGIASTTIPSLSNPLHLAGGCLLVYVTNNQILEDTSRTPGCVPPPYLCDASGACSPTIIFSPLSKLSTVVAYPGRQDALVLEFNTTLYAISIDPRSPQFFAPILTGTAPITGALPDGTIVVHNGTAVYKLSM